MINSTLNDILIPAEEFIYGTADLDGLIGKKFGRLRYGISIGRRLDDSIIDSIAQGPTLEYYHYYNQINRELGEISERIRHKLEAAGFNAVVVSPTVPADMKESKHYLKTLSVDVSHKMVATRAGLGWIGKTDLFISERWGPRVRLCSILIDRNPGNLAVPVEESRCGKCDICVKHCPAEAATGALWNTGIHRDIFFNAHKCREMCGILARQRFNMDIRICGMCVAVCPVGKKGRLKAKA